MSTGNDYFDGQNSRDAEVESLREQLVQRDRRVAELEAACRKLCTWADNPLPNDPGVQAEWVETVRMVRAALSVPRRSFAHEDPNAPPSAERIEYAEKRAAYLGELLDWKAAPPSPACETCGKRRGFNSLCSSEFHCCVDCVWGDGVCLEMCERCAKLDAYFKAERAESNPACQK
jgi:hypothetical protein